MNLGILSKYRSELMGLSAISILICHAPGNGVLMPAILNKILSLGTYGVDVFFFLSGFGLWFSLENHFKNSGGGITKWYQKRYLRLLVPYLIIAIPYSIAHCIIKEESYWFIPNYVFTLTFWTKHIGAWFIDALIPIYLLTPALFKGFKKVHNNWRIMLILCIIPLILAIIPNNSIEPRYTIWGNIQFVLLRVPSFIFGMWLAPYIKQEKKVPYIGLIIISSILFFLISSLLGFWGATFMSIPFLAFFLIIIHYSNNLIGGLFRFMGKISLESYMFNVCLPLLLIKNMNWQICNIDLSYGQYIPYLSVIILGIGGSCLVHNLSNYLIRKI